MKQPKLELLSPAGSWEALEAAVRSGADAVYLGGSLFSARANAQNFDHDTLKQAVAYCHARGVKVHLAVNTILLNHEIAPALDFVAFACTLPVDAVIVQDTGLLHLLRQAAPTLQIHASTQMSVHTPEGAKLLAERGGVYCDPGPEAQQERPVKWRLLAVACEHSGAGTAASTR